VITFVSPAQRLSRAFNHVGQNSMKISSSSGSVLPGHQQTGLMQLARALSAISNETPKNQGVPA
ncbi:MULTISPECIES: hypothetical protein, partial [unclassified Burkholderia]|uniref:hypothetical protein n=1 Tax=unclassified Burkholderia TaxID=2613784 RepID=UPI001BB11D49